MKPRVYLETTIPSYLTARSSHDLIKAAWQAITRDWWQVRHNFELYVSQVVLKEVSGGHPEAAARRVQLLDGIPVLSVTPEVEMLAQEFVARGAMPRKSEIDALHVSLAAVNGLEYLLTWNCTHIANAAIRSQIERLCRAHDYEPPIICTPVELMEI